MDDSQLLRGVLDLAVLSLLDRKDSYGYEIVTELRSRGLDDVGEASVYGTLRRLLADGLVEDYVVASASGPDRKYYRLLDAGRARRHDDAKAWRRFVEIMDHVTERGAR